eukprot:Colp12_sorted_trinity150504_noHs@19239
MAFNAESDVQSLKEAINGRDEDALIKVLSNRDHSQRQEVRKLYATAYESDLVTDLQSVLGLNCEDAVLSLFMTSPQYDAYSLYKAMRVSRVFFLGICFYNITPFHNLYPAPTFH